MRRRGIYVQLISLRFSSTVCGIPIRTYKMSSDPDATWSGVPLSEIYGAQSPWGSPEFPLVTPSFNHTVLYHIPANGEMPCDRPPKPQVGHDKWDHEFVRMPCSNRCLCTVENQNKDSPLKKRWQIIENSLSKPMRNTKDLSDAIFSYNTKFKKLWKFQALHKLFNEYLEEEETQYFFDVTLPEIAKLALELPKLIQAPIPLLQQHKNRSVSLSQLQIASLLANAFFCTFPRRNSYKKESEYASYPHINFNSLYETSGSDAVLEKLKCICHYFRRVCTKVPLGVVTWSRRSVAPRSCPEWGSSDVLVAGVPLHVDSKGTIEDADGLIQIDFANKYLGGGVLNYGCVQEEIRFVICPELLISMLLAEVMRPNEAVLIIGCERYSKYSGYSSSFRWTGDFRDETPLDSSGRRRCAVLAIDAAPYSGQKHEFRKDMVLRELNKAWVGFSFHSESQGERLVVPGLATGNWGCGAFGGTQTLKSLLQLMACAQIRRPMAYYTFEDVTLRDDIIHMYNMLARHNVTVGQLFQYIVKFCESDISKCDLNSFLCQIIRDKAADGAVLNNNQDVMDISTSSETSLSNSIQNGFLNEIADSPDLFSQEDSLIEVKIDKNVPETDRQDDQTKLSGQTSRLMDEMQKMDEQSGLLNLSMPHTSPLKQRSEIHSSDSEPAMDDKTNADSASELKKKVNRLITDFFSKKPI